MSNGRRLFDLVKRIKKSGAFHPSKPNLRPSEFMMLHSIMRFTARNRKNGLEDGVSISELSEFLQMTPSAVSQTVKSLVNKQLAERKSNPNDRRIGYVSLTPEGYGIFLNTEREMSDKLNRLVSVLGTEEIEQLFKLLENLATALENMDQPED